MNTKLLYTALAATALCAGSVWADDQKPSDQKSLGQKTTETLEKAKDKTVEAGRIVAEDTKKAAGVVKDAVTPDADARKVDVTLTEHNIDMPRQIAPGKTAFVVRNNGKERQNFKIEGQGLEKEFIIAVAPNDTKTLSVELKPGDYKVFVPEKESSSRGNEIGLRVK
jgi:uncharacterized cupredoxin-like copper-binding protein